MEQELQIASDIQKGILRDDKQETHAGIVTNAESAKDIEVQDLLVPMP